MCCTEGDDHHHEKPSVLNKVKAKAKKIKETLKKHGHGHNHDHDHDGHVPDDLDLEEEDEEYEEMVEDPEDHGAPSTLLCKFLSKFVLVNIGSKIGYIW